MLQTKTWYKNKTWFFLHGKVIYIRKWNKTYKISNKAFVDLMEYVFPVIKEQAVTNEDFEKYCEDNKYKQFEVIKEKVQSILTNQYIVDEEALKTPSPQLIILDDERLEKKWMFKRYTNVIVSKYQIHQEKAVGSKGPIILLIKSIEKVQEQVEHLFECYRGLEKLSIVFPFQQEVILYQGTLEGLMNLVKFLTCFETNEDIHPPHLDAALYKAISLLHDSKNQDEKVFRIDLSTSQIFTEMIYLLDPCEYRSDKTNLEDITFEPEKAHHIVIFQLNKLVKSLPYLIEKLEYGKLQQVPYKVASCSFRVNGQKNRIYVSGESPQEVYKDAFRQGLTKVLQMSDENKKEIGQFTNWVVAEKLEQIYTEGIIPLVFQYVREHSPEKAKSWCIHPNEIRDHIIVRLIQEVQENRFGDRFKFKIDAIPHAGLYEISLIDQDKVLWKRYDIHLKEALFAGLVQLYGLFYQNESITNEMLTEKDSGYYSVQEALIDQVLDGAASKDVLTLVSDVLDQMGCRIELVEWKYNHYLKEAGMSCYKILMGMEESS